MAQHGLFTYLVYYLVIPLVSAHDYRFISRQDLEVSIKKFSREGITSYYPMLFDVSRNIIIVGAKNILLRLSLADFELLESATWEAPKDEISGCITKGQSEDLCQNYIKILSRRGKLLFTCGTHAFSPECSWRKIEDLSHVIDRVTGVAKCPYNPEANVTSIMLENGEYYFGGPTDFSGSDSLLAKSTDENKTIRTEQYNSLWLNEPEFVGSFETNQFVYFLFREAAVEYINCGKIIYSRIARVCKNDSGGVLNNNWATFIKARLNCSISGEYPYYFNEIQSVYYVPDENVVYATFSTPVIGFGASAICSFNLSAINSAFEEPFKYQDHSDNTWRKVDIPHRDHFQCKRSSSSHLLESSNYHLMDSAVQASTVNPLHISNNERFTHLTVDVLSTKLHSAVHVIYVSTLEGLIKKISVLPRTQETCIFEVWQTGADVAAPIKNMQFIKQTNSVYITTDVSLVKIPAAHCNRHLSSSSCINAMDPYCGWNHLNESCTTAPENNPLNKYWDQSITSCPTLDRPVDGGWSSWTPWNVCIHRTNSGDNRDSCLCQQRYCKNPSPANGGRECKGMSVAVANCTIHGNWSDWSAWSACSASCPTCTSVKNRTRTCTNPEPAFGGRVCVGPAIKEVDCLEQLPTAMQPKDGEWSRWDQWSSCSAPCGGGFKKRLRYCNSPSPRNGGKDCIGQGIEYTECGKEQCEEEKKHIHTNWIKSRNSSGSGFNLTRYRFVCKANVKYKSDVKISYKEEFKTCTDENQCSSKIISQKPKWSSWSEWGDCTVPCGGGSQNRTRYCEGNGCEGSDQISRLCNNHSCQDEWSCWSDWSPCNVSCGWGAQVRSRNCLTGYCKRVDREIQACDSGPCESTLGWSNWTVWSVCDSNNLQYRKRLCRSSNPGVNLCQGRSTESRMCIMSNLNDVIINGATMYQASMSACAVVGYILLGIVLGLVTGGSIVYIYIKKKKVGIPSSPHYLTKQNPYTTVPLHDRSKKITTSTSNSILNNAHNGTIKSVKCYDYDTIKKHSHGVAKHNDDTLYYD